MAGLRRSAVVFVSCICPVCAFALQRWGHAGKVCGVRGGLLAGLRKQQYYDMKKREYCAKHGIKLVLIPYWDESKITFDYIMKAAGY